MIIFYQNRELAEKLNINLSRWKRWAREFLEPDPLGGLQSGYARQYGKSEAFIVFLGGYLVRDLKFSIPAAKSIVNDLKEWMADTYDSYPRSTQSEKTTADAHVKDYRIHIFYNRNTQANRPMSYIIRELVAESSVVENGANLITERYIEKRLKSVGVGAESPDTNVTPDWMRSRILYITLLHKAFEDSLDSVPEDKL